MESIKQPVYDVNLEATFKNFASGRSRPKDFANALMYAFPEYKDREVMSRTIDNGPMFESLVEVNPYKYQSYKNSLEQEIFDMSEKNKALDREIEQELKKSNRNEGKISRLTREIFDTCHILQIQYQSKKLQILENVFMPLAEEFQKAWDQRHQDK